MININVRSIYGKDLTGVQRYATELIDRFPSFNAVSSPLGFENGIKGQLWDQAVLPLQLDGLLWSPANLGPVLYRPQVITVHDISPIDHPEWFDPKYVAMTRLLLPPLLKNVQHILTVSEFSRRRLIETFHLPVSKVTALPLAADSKFSPLTLEQQQQHRVLHGWPTRFVLSVGSLEPRKNLKSLFAAWNSWENRPRDLKLLVAGGQGKVFSSIGFDAVPAGVVLLGRVPDEHLPALYACAEAFVYPSLYEGFGLPPLEAMSCGTPVITSNVASLPEVVGDAALTVSPQDTAALREALWRVVGDAELATELRQRGLARAQGFSWETTAELTWQILTHEAERL
ncbi:glycosyltransferase family 1 protein (plasmid) [Deinococcus wulumuqiensis]|uniref:Glycosyltransferase family 1 protein n=1 Tax=Deinococcus wulumuqiensis TaxID=980427 RepID=A0A345IKV2_9DEIO|nr:glycosyltransferase family 1 protein [Deinococcus wulumuqiensis]AXH00325.1 glycosyltransferase family 1 protein [Deinococcus wulumuqiensis]